MYCDPNSSFDDVEDLKRAMSALTLTFAVNVSANGGLTYELSFEGFDFFKLPMGINTTPEAINWSSPYTF